MSKLNTGDLGTAPELAQQVLDRGSAGAAVGRPRQVFRRICERRPLFGGGAAGQSAGLTDMTKSTCFPLARLREGECVAVNPGTSSCCSTLNPALSRQRARELGVASLVLAMRRRESVGGGASQGMRHHPVTDAHCLRVGHRALLEMHGQGVGRLHRALAAAGRQNVASQPWQVGARPSHDVRVSGRASVGDLRRTAGRLARDVASVVRKWLPVTLGGVCRCQTPDGHDEGGKDQGLRGPAFIGGLREA